MGRTRAHTPPQRPLSASQGPAASHPSHPGLPAPPAALHGRTGRASALSRDRTGNRRPWPPAVTRPMTPKKYRKRNRKIVDKLSITVYNTTMERHPEGESKQGFSVRETTQGLCPYDPALAARRYAPMPPRVPLRSAVRSAHYVGGSAPMPLHTVPCTLPRRHAITLTMARPHITPILISGANPAASYHSPGPCSQADAAGSDFRPLLCSVSTLPQSWTGPHKEAAGHPPGHDLPVIQAAVSPQFATDRPCFPAVFTPRRFWHTVTIFKTICNARKERFLCLIYPANPPAGPPFGPMMGG